MEEPLTTPRVFKKLPTYDPRTWRAAMVYAQALVGAAQHAGNAASVVEEIDSFVDDVLDKLPKLESVLTSGFVDEETKEAMLEKAFGKSASPVFMGFLRTVARHGRLDMLRLIHLTVHEEFSRVQGKIRVLVSTAEPLDAAAEEKIAQEVQQRIGLVPMLEKQVHPELIGGIVLRIGDRVYDGSIATQLQRLREKMTTRSLHEIQSRRDSFSSAN